jgi:hypothetical protein
MEEQKNQENQNVIVDKETEAKLNDIREHEVKAEPEAEIKTVVPKPKSDYVEIIELIKLMLSTNDKFNELIAKAKITIEVNQSSQIKNILNYLVGQTEGDDETPINNVVKQALEILADNKVELYEIPSLINVIHESLKNLHSIKITIQDIGILIKLILFILIETKTVKVSNNDYKLISKVIDTSMALLNKSVEIKVPKLNKCVCF